MYYPKRIVDKRTKTQTTPTASEARATASAQVRSYDAQTCVLATARTSDTAGDKPMFLFYPKRIVDKRTKTQTTPIASEARAIASAQVRSYDAQTCLLAIARTSETAADTG